MATSSITKQFVLQDDEAAKRLLKVLNEETKRKTEKRHTFEQGEAKLKQLRLR